MGNIFDIEVSILKDKGTSNKSIIIIDEESSINEDLMTVFNDYSNLKIIIVGLSKKSNEYYVNLLDLSQLKNNFQNAFENKKTGLLPLLLLKNIKQQIRSLFKSHGEKSLFDLLNIIRQSVSIGPGLIKQDIVDWEEYEKNYLKPGLRNWEAFKIRFKKHKDYLKVCGFDNETDEIESNINNIQQYIDKLKTMTKDQVNRLNEDEIRLNADRLKNIDLVLTKIKQRIDTVYNVE